MSAGIGTGTTTGWAVLGPGGIARTFLKELPSTTGRLVAVGSSDPARSAAFAEEAAGLGYADVTAGTYAEALADPRVTAVYIATVHTGHAALVLDAIAAGKAVLCEKPLTPNLGTTHGARGRGPAGRRPARRGVHVPLPPADRARCSG